MNSLFAIYHVLGYQLETWSFGNRNGGKAKIMNRLESTNSSYRIEAMKTGLEVYNDLIRRSPGLSRHNPQTMDSILPELCRIYDVCFLIHQTGKLIDSLLASR